MKLCECGCGQPTTPCLRTQKSKGMVKGEPNRFLPKHGKRKAYRSGLGDIEVHPLGCWIWRGSVGRGGYGRMAYSNGRSGSGLAHRLYYEEFVGPVPDGMQLDHLCKVRSCVNPEHLEPVTPAENVRRSTLTNLTRDDVRAIRTVNLSASQLAYHFGIRQQAVTKIRLRQRWTDAA